MLSALLAGNLACGGGARGPAVEPADRIQILDQAVAAVPGSVVTPISQADGALTGPHFRLKFDRSTVSGTTYGMVDSRGYTDNQPHAAANGHEFIGLSSDTVNIYDTSKIAVSVVIDGAERPVPVAGSAFGFVVSVPVGHTALLKVVDEGRAQTFDMRAGRRGSDAVVGYYPPRSLAWPKHSDNADFYVSRATCDDPSTAGTGLKDACGFEVSFSLFGGTIDLQPWLPRLGWAPPGRIWVSTTAFIDVDPGLHTLMDVTFTLDPAKSFTLTLPDGTVSPGRIAEGADHMVHQPQGATLAFDAPDSITGGVVTVQGLGTFTPSGVTWVKAPEAKQFQLTAKEPTAS
ncbi:hypothetical protein [Catenulispora yoronensis]|uniref:hypothetical protein n=1 Tax=Catenulispora yoronensis TaxID=450799 RepID=UPI0031CE5A01